MSDETWRELESLVGSVTAGLMRRFGRWVEAEDLSQTIWAYYFEHRAELDAYADSAILRARLRRAGVRLCQREMAYHLGMDLDEQHHYGRGEVRALIRHALAGGPTGEEGESVWVGWMDVRRGLECLSAVEHEALRVAYGPDERDALTPAERSLAARAVAKVRQAMNEPVGVF